jgi:hypothetical protein
MVSDNVNVLTETDNKTNKNLMTVTRDKAVWRPASGFRFKATVLPERKCFTET